jgi:hypothetical protein
LDQILSRDFLPSILPSKALGNGNSSFSLQKLALIYRTSTQPQDSALQSQWMCEDGVDLADFFWILRACLAAYLATRQATMTNVFVLRTDDVHSLAELNGLQASFEANWTFHLESMEGERLKAMQELGQLSALVSWAVGNVQASSTLALS